MKALLSGPNGNLGDQIQKFADFKVQPIHRGEWEDYSSKSLAGFHTFIHCAYDLKNTIHEQPAKVIDSNLLTTMKALEICKENNIPNFLFISSCSVYGHSSKTTESTACNPITINGLTKLLNERIILSFCKENKIKPIILRAFNSYGGNDEFSIISKLIKASKSGETFKLYNGGLAERDFIHITDLAKIVCQFSITPPEPSIMNIGTGESTRIINIVKYFEKKFGKFKIESRKNLEEVAFSRADITKLKNEIEFKFLNIYECIDCL